VIFIHNKGTGNFNIQQLEGYTALSALGRVVLSVHPFVKWAYFCLFFVRYYTEAKGFLKLYK
jgi:hypothetical protein